MPESDPLADALVEAAKEVAADRERRSAEEDEARKREAAGTAEQGILDAEVRAIVDGFTRRARAAAIPLQRIEFDVRVKWKGIDWMFSSPKEKVVSATVREGWIVPGEILGLAVLDDGTLVESMWHVGSNPKLKHASVKDVTLRIRDRSRLEKLKRQLARYLAEHGVTQAG
jgi:hypothetical protein